MSLQTRFTFTGGPGGTYVSTMHFTGTTQTNAQNAADAVRTFWASLQSALTSDLTGRLSEEVLIINDVTGQPTGRFVIDPDDPISFTNNNQPLPWTTQGLVRWRTGVFDNGREIRGRTFIPGFPEDHNDDGRPLSTTVGALATIIGVLLSDPDAELAVRSKTAGAAAVVTDGSMWAEWAVLRSRRD